MLVALLVLLPIASAQAAPPTCTSFFRAAEDDGRPTGGSVGCRGPLDVPLHGSSSCRGPPARDADRRSRTGRGRPATPRRVLAYTPARRPPRRRTPSRCARRSPARASSTSCSSTVVEAGRRPAGVQLRLDQRGARPGPGQLDAGETAYGNVACGDDEGATLACRGRVAAGARRAERARAARWLLPGRAVHATGRARATAARTSSRSARERRHAHRSSRSAAIDVDRADERRADVPRHPVHLARHGPTFQPLRGQGRASRSTLTFGLRRPGGRDPELRGASPRPRTARSCSTQPDKMIGVR